MSGGSWVQSSVWPSFLFNNIGDRTSCLAGVSALSILSKHGRMASLSSLACLIQVDIVEFQPLISPVIPEIVNLLKDIDWVICQAGADALSQLLDQGKTGINQVWGFAEVDTS